MRTITILPIVLLLLFACQEFEPKKEPDEIVLIFQEAKVQGELLRKTGKNRIESCLLEYRDDDKVVRSISPDSSVVYDTMRIATHQAFLEFAHTYRRFDKLSYIFKKGDTVLFSYPDLQPYAQILNRREDSISVNYDLHWRKQITYSALPAHKRNVVIEWIESQDREKPSENFEEEMAEIQSEIVRAGKQELKEELLLLDSLKRLQILDSATYTLRKTKALLQDKQLELKSSLNYASRFQTEREIEASHLSIHEVIDGVDVPVFTNVLAEEQGDLLAYNAYMELLSCYFLFYGRKVKRITERMDHNGQPGSLMNNPDFFARYDSIENNSLFSGDVKRLLLQWELENIIKFKSNQDTEEYLGRYEARYADSAFMKYLDETYALGTLNSDTSQADLTLLSSTGENILYQDLLHRHKGKVLYLDFWSSSCGPCRTEMPASAKLKDSFKENEVVFLYFSLDTNEDRWEKACDKFQLQEESYLVKNKFTSGEFERLKVDWIPHYMIYDKRGTRVVEYAPRPSETASKELLHRYLLES